MAQVSNKIEASVGGVGSNPIAPTLSRPNHSADLPSGLNVPAVENTVGVPDAAGALVAGAPLCAACWDRASLPHEVMRTPDGDTVGKCQLCGRKTSFRFTPVVLPAGTEGAPFGVDFIEAHGRWTVQVRDEAGVVAYVRVGERTRKAAAWAALEWLRGYAAKANAPASTGALDAAVAMRALLELERTPAPLVLPAPVRERIHRAAEGRFPHADPALWEGDPLQVLMALRGIGEAARERMIAALERREAKWERLADEVGCDPVTVACARERADEDLCEVFAALGGGA